MRQRRVARPDSIGHWLDCLASKNPVSWTVWSVVTLKPDWLQPIGSDDVRWVASSPKPKSGFRANWIPIRETAMTCSVTGNFDSASVQVKTIRRSWPPTVGLFKGIER